LLKRLKEEIQKRIELQNEYNNNLARIKDFEKQLQKWKETTEAELIKKQNLYDEKVSKFNDQVQNYEQQLFAKEQKITQLQEALNAKDKEIATLKTAAPVPVNTPISRQSSAATIPSIPLTQTTSVNPVSSTTVQKQDRPEELEVMPFKSFRGAWLDLTSKSDLILELLFKPDLILVSSICEVAPTKDDVIKSIVHLFEARGQALYILDTFINKEVAKTSKCYY
jgi:vacuolar-type H+-ATPase subunit I/STV1